MVYSIYYIDVIYWSCFGQQKHPVSYHLLILLQHKHKDEDDDHDEDQESFQSSIHQFYLKNKNISILNIILEYSMTSRQGKTKS